MVNIRDYLKKKEKKKKKEDSFAKKIFRHRLAIIYRTVLVIAVFIAAGIVIAIQMKNRVFSEYQVLTSVPRENISGSITLSLGETILTYSNDGANCMNKKGEILWNQTYEMQNPIVKTCRDTVAIGDYNGRDIYLMNSQNIIGKIDTKMPIRNFAVSANGIVAVVLDDTNITWIYLFDSSENVIAYFKTTMKKSGYPICVTISDSGTLVGVSYLYMDSGIMKSTAAFYNFGPVGQNEIDNFVSSYDYIDTVVPFLQFLNDEKAVAVADNRLVLYEGTQKPVSIADILIDSEIIAPFYNEQYVAIVYRDVTGNGLYKVDVYEGNGKLVDTVLLDMQYSEILFTKDKMIVYNEQKCLVHTIGGVDNFSGEFDKQVLNLIPSNSSYEYTVVTPDSVDVIQLK